jgi:VWFA-related protein
MRKVSVLVCIVLLVVLVTAGFGAFLWSRSDSVTEQHISAGVRIAQVDTSNYPEVKLYLSASSEDGQAITTLTQDAFEIVEDGAAVEISEFHTPGTSTISTLLLLDCSGSMDNDNKIDGAREAASSYVELMRPTDQAAIVTFCTGVNQVQGFTSDQAELNDAISEIYADGPTPLYDGLVESLDILADQPGRRALILLSDGKDCYYSPCVNSPGSEATLDEVIDLAQAYNIDIQAIGLGDRRDRLFDEPTLLRIANETGGNYFYAPEASELADLYTQLGGTLQQEYAISYISPRPYYDGTRRDIDVVVNGDSIAANYIEQHLINVQSNPYLAVAFLVPLLGALAAPSLLRRRQAPPQSNLAGVPPITVINAEPESFANTGQTLLGQYASAQVVPVEHSSTPQAATRQCSNCGSSLRASARFCQACGSDQAHSQAPQRVFCDQCGRPMKAEAKFCSACGATALQRKGDFS